MRKDSMKFKSNCCKKDIRVKEKTNEATTR